MTGIALGLSTGQRNMAGLLLAASITAPLSLPASSVPAASPSWSVSALCNEEVEGGSIACKLQDYSSSHWTARGQFVKSGNVTGWNALNITANTKSAPSDRVAAYAAGFVEGALTPDMINLQWRNLNLGQVDPAVQSFVEANTKWVTSQVAEHAATDEYWASVGLVYAQYDGLVAGYRADKAHAVLTPLQILLIGMSVELDDVKAAAVPSSRPDYLAMRERDFHEFVLTHSHCSAMIKVTADLSELFSAHNTWSGYSDALRVWKVYELPFASSKAHTVSFPGYFARIAGIDDFYVTSQNLAVIETTNSVFNTSLFDAVTAAGTVPYWVRATLANRVASTAPEWHEAFYKFNSGTYNNQWMTVDYKLFTPGMPLPPHTLWVSEQIPGYHAAADQTTALQRGHWPSYNVAFYPEIYERSGYPTVVKVFGEGQSYQLAPRAQIFRRDADGSVRDLPSLQTFMRLNRYGRTPSDPLFPSPVAAIAARGDLLPIKPMPFGAFDGKITSHELMMRRGLATAAISGPTSIDQPVFEWSGPWANLTKYPHYGHPTRFDFGWEVFAAQGGGA